ncbi:hypothetical protein [Magnetospirillum sulfuroxidans]|uniref:Uncharacterized protein n=1 Tax=Magnetospirillum sulfuroxidans TaxID=611300 RepID=A0ABS5IGY7_9PROT|nr:hypothetical protein [Magnetospirillum sulfuroxidans]MBR9973687.1 hypothetical protein [Magnetospirillum sulfuroxidans]
MQRLLDAAASEQTALNLSWGVSLSTDQVAALTHDIVWFETVVVDGQTVLAPRLYLAQAHQDNLAPQSAGIIASAANLQAARVVNSGLIAATGALSVTASGDVVILVEWQRQGADLAKLAGGLAAIVAGAKTAADVNTAANSGETVATHNVLETVIDIASLALSLNELRVVLTDDDATKLDILLAGGAVVIDGIATVVPFLPGGAGIVLKASKKGGEAVVKITTKAGDDITEAVKFANKDVWTLSATERGKVIEQRLAQTDYKDWFNVGQEKNGFFPLVDVQKGDTLVSMDGEDDGSYCRAW